MRVADVAATNWRTTALAWLALLAYTLLRLHDPNRPGKRRVGERTKKKECQQILDAHRKRPPTTTAACRGSDGFGPQGPGCEVSEAVDWVVGDALEQDAEVCLRIPAVQLGGAD